MNTLSEIFQSADAVATEADGTMYVGMLDPEAGQSFTEAEMLTQPRFRIVRIAAHSADTAVQTFLFPSGSDSYTNAFSDRASFTYKTLKR